MQDVDLIYVDPPFNTGKTQSGSKGAYRDYDSDYDTWVDEMVRTIHGALADTGSMFWHCDWRSLPRTWLTIERHFGKKSFKNDIIWSYNSGGGARVGLSRKHDTILWFVKDAKKAKINVLREPYPRDYGDRPGFHPEGRVMNDVWQVPFLSTTSVERVGYPNQKPIALIDRIIQLSTDPGDLVVDPCCGSGTTVVAAMLSNRRSIGVDLNPEAISVCQERASLVGVDAV